MTSFPRYGTRGIKIVYFYLNKGGTANFRPFENLWSFYLVTFIKFGKAIL